MNRVAAYFDRQAERFGPSGILPHHEARVDRLGRLVGEPPMRVLELGCGSGGTASACARRGYQVTAIELSPRRARFAQELAIEQVEASIAVYEGDFYDQDLGGPFDVVAYWNGFGVGTDEDQRRLLRRVAQEWLVPGGRMLVDVFNPAWWTRVPPETKRHDEYDAWQQTTYDPIRARFVDRWWSLEDESDLLFQTVRCYAPPDLLLLVEGTGLEVERFEVEEGGEDLSRLGEAYSYLAVLRGVTTTGSFGT